MYFLLITSFSLKYYKALYVTTHVHGVPIGGFHVTSSRPCWWTRTIDFSLAPFVRPPAFVHFTIVICISRDWLQLSQGLTHFCRSLFRINGVQGVMFGPDFITVTKVSR